MRVRMIVPVLVLICCSVVASVGAKSKDVSGKSQAVTRQEWLQYMQGALPKELCKAESFFRQCFTHVDESTCLKVATDATDECSNAQAAKMPKKLQLPDDGRTWGQTLGQCTGKTYAHTMEPQHKFKDTKKCNNWSAPQ